MNMESILKANTSATVLFSWNASMSTTMKLQVANMSLVLSWLTWNRAPWTVSAQDLMVAFSVPTTLSLARAELETTGPRVTTLKELNWSIPY